MTYSFKVEERMEGNEAFRMFYIRWMNLIGHIRVNHVNHGFGTNVVRNTKYRWWSFVFVCLFEQLM